MEESCDIAHNKKDRFCDNFYKPISFCSAPSATNPSATSTGIPTHPRTSPPVTSKRCDQRRLNLVTRFLPAPGRPGAVVAHSLDEPRRDLLRHHHPPGDPPRHLHLGAGTDRRDPTLHRRLQRPVPTLRRDQDRRPDPRQRQTETHFINGTLGGVA